MDEPVINPESDETPAPASPRQPMMAPSARAEKEESSQRLVMLSIRLLYLVLLMMITMLPFVGSITEGVQYNRWVIGGVFLATFAAGVLVLIADARTPKKRLASVFGIYLGVVAGLAAALAIGALLDLIAESWDLTTPTWKAYFGLIKLAVGITLCYLAVSIVLTTKDDVRLVIPYVEFAKQVRGTRPMLLDTSALIDGRIDGYAQTGFLDAPLVVPQFVINELQTLADSGDKLKRARGRRGLEMVSQLQANPRVDISIDNADVPGHTVDHMLLRLAEDQQLRVLTTDYNLNKVAKIHGVTVLNLNDVANTLRPQVIVGDELAVEIVKPGEAPDQGVGYMPDGTMVVVENAADRIGESINLVVTNSLQTSAGRMIFGRYEGEADSDARAVRHMADAATHQPRATERPTPRRDSAARRNPRR
jgi:uncharacterized protein YacL